MKPLSLLDSFGGIHVNTEGSHIMDFVIGRSERI